MPRVPQSNVFLVGAESGISLGSVTLGAGGNTIGNVGLNTGSNSIGNVGLNAGSNIIGKVRPVPLDYGSLGVYSLSMKTGTMAAGLAADSEIFHFRWPDTTRFCLPLLVRIWAGNAGTAFAAGAFSFDLFIARGWSADGSGGTAADVSGPNQKLKQGMADSLLGSARIASTGALTAGTKTLDAQPIARVGGGVAATAGASLVSPPGVLYDALGGVLQPIVLDSSNGFVGVHGLVIRATVPATGTWVGGVDIVWAELTALTGY